jgi:hypothetical protein
MFCGSDRIEPCALYVQIAQQNASPSIPKCLFTQKSFNDSLTTISRRYSQKAARPLILVGKQEVQMEQGIEVTCLSFIEIKLLSF